MRKHILILPGDGIGPEVAAEAVRVLVWFRDSRALDLAWSEALIGGAAIDATSNPLPEATLSAARAADAVLMGAIGGPRWDRLDFAARPEAGLLGIRKALEVFANLRPAIVFDALIDASPLKREFVTGLDIMIVRELTGGVYFGEPRGIAELAGGERRGVNTQVYTTGEIRRVAEVAFDLARKRRSRVCSVEKANVMETGRLWREEVTRLRDEAYSDIELSHMYADNCAMQLIRRPAQFDVIVTDNLFGDILSDEASMLTGSLGMLPSASLGAVDGDGRRPALFEPVHGSAPDIAGRGSANPLAMLLSLAMLFRHAIDLPEEATRLETAVARVLGEGARTADIAAVGEAAIGTHAMGSAVLAALEAA